eukprot:CAMPEP_0194730720 /NCGR_PEP_ID=MMETSP0296-20130528/54054_1 /TAXON_ID=39354 /ORGANISM="Heterosigma akashiwo, Strain CCMP2393" /LENGTH=41 /DNA_ID= /DNA_START= /DNA_END= /DNA_ORIENTATION=
MSSNCCILLAISGSKETKSCLDNGEPITNFKKQGLRFKGDR